MEANKPITIVILLVIGLVIIFLFVIPKYQESNALQGDLIQAQFQYDNQADYYQRVSKILSSIKSKQDSLEKMNSALPSEAALAPIVSFLQRKAVENGLTMKSVVFSKETPTAYGQLYPADSGDATIKDLTFAVNLSGQYQGLRNFLSALDRSARLFEVNIISFSALEPSQTLPPQKNILQMYHFQIEVKTHTY